MTDYKPKPVKLPEGIFRKDGWLTDGKVVFLDTDTARDYVEGRLRPAASAIGNNRT